MTMAENQFLLNAEAAARLGGDIWPAFAACEAALESAYGTSELARDLNLFGMKQHVHPIYGTVVLPTREFENGEWEVINSSWIVYPTWAACFGDRMATLKRLAPFYPNYAAALGAADGRSYVIDVSKTWASDPRRGAKVLAIYDEKAALSS